MPIREVQTDNGSEFTMALRVKDPKQKTMFEKALETLDIKYHQIRVATPQHNGKVERQHRIDEQRFYVKIREQLISGVFIKRNFFSFPIQVYFIQFSLCDFII